MPKRKILNSKYTLIFGKYFPYMQNSKGGYRVLLGIGGNIGDTLRRFEHLFWYFKRSRLIHVVESSPVLKNPPFGYKKQDDFYNALLWIETLLTPRALLRYIMRVEHLFGRKRSFKNAPRKLDIDIIFYENRTIETKALTLPHHSWINRDSVLIPLSMMRTIFAKEKNDT